MRLTAAPVRWKTNLSHAIAVLILCMVDICAFAQLSFQHIAPPTPDQRRVAEPVSPLKCEYSRGSAAIELVVSPQLLQQLEGLGLDVPALTREATAGIDASGCYVIDPAAKDQLRMTIAEISYRQGGIGQLMLGMMPPHSLVRNTFQGHLLAYLLDVVVTRGAVNTGTTGQAGAEVMSMGLTRKFYVVRGLSQQSLYSGDDRNKAHVLPFGWAIEDPLRKLK